jgi:tripartite-type tricarboxylate transporter receptor subunit TctC
MFDTRKRRLLIAGAAATGGLALSRYAISQEKFPSRPMQLVVPFGAGGGTDIVARALAAGMSAELGQNILVENRTGAAGAIGAAHVAQSAPNGYTMMVGQTGTTAVNQHLYPSLPYDPATSFEAVSLLNRISNVLVVHPSFPATTFDEFVRLAKANPGKYFNGMIAGGSAHLAMELLKSVAGLEITNIPYKGAGQMVLDFQGGRYPVMMDVVLNQLQYIRQGKARVLATTSRTRIPALPDVPTVAETFPGFEAIGFMGLFVPAKTPRPIIDQLNAAVRAALKMPAFERMSANDGLEVQASSPEELKAFVQSESVKWGKVIRDAKITPAS